MPHGERPVARLVMRPHEQPMRFLVVRLALQEALQGTDRLRWFLPLELEQRELLRGDHELTIGLFALALDPRGRQVSQELAAMDGDRRAIVRDRITRASGIAGLAPTPERAEEHLEIVADHQRQAEARPMVGAGAAPRLRR